MWGIIASVAGNLEWVVPPLIKGRLPLAKLVSPSSVIDSITQKFGPQSPNWYSRFGYAGHNGIDFGFQESEIRAIDKGAVTVAGFDPAGYGVWVAITHEWGGESRYAHGLRGSLKVRGGDIVTAGQPLFAGASSGNSTGPHLHLEIRMVSATHLHTPGMKTCVDPMPYLPVEIGGEGKQIGEAHVEDAVAGLQKEIALLMKELAVNRELKGKFEWGLQELLGVQLAANVQSSLLETQKATVQNVRVELERARGNL